MASTLKWTPSSYINQIQNDDIADSQQRLNIYIYIYCLFILFYQIVRIFDKSLLNHDTKLEYFYSWSYQLKHQGFPKFCFYFLFYGKDFQNV